MGAHLGSQTDSKVETLCQSMELVISVSEAELEEFPEEEAPESSGQQEQSGKTSLYTRYCKKLIIH